MKEKKRFICSNCGNEEPKWSGKCSVCGSWNTFEEAIVRNTKNRTKSKVVSKKSEPIRLSQVNQSENERIITSFKEFNRVMGGGIVPDSLTIMSGPPGGGKSTLSLMVANDAAERGYKVLYASGEESESQIKSRASRVLKNIMDNLWIVSDESMDNVIDAVQDVDPDLIIIDSIQTFSLAEYLPARAGNAVQTMECASELLRIAKTSERKRAVIMISQMNKSEQLAGLRALEHLVDTVLIIQGENQEELRTVLTTKNRFGSTGEMGFFTMTEAGMISVDNPSEFFITKREKGEEVSGCALSVVREGTRPIILEIESLVSTSYTPFPTRITESLSKDQLNTLISVLEQRGGINLSDKNVVIKATGGLKLKDQSINLSVIMSIVSSVLKRPIPNDVVFIGDVGLTGEVKKVPSTELRIKELSRMGFEKVYISKNTFSRNITFNGIKVIEVKTLNEVINHIFGDK